MLLEELKLRRCVCFIGTWWLNNKDVIVFCDDGVKKFFDVPDTYSMWVELHDSPGVDRVLVERTQFPFWFVFDGEAMNVSTEAYRLFHRHGDRLYIGFKYEG